jgi:hypothetical protein
MGYLAHMQMEETKRGRVGSFQYNFLLDVIDNNVVSLATLPSLYPLATIATELLEFLLTSGKFLCVTLYGKFVANQADNCSIYY